MREQFFSPKGLTSTSANYVANLAKEFIQTQRIYIETLSFVGENKQAGGHTYITSCATPREEFDQLIPIINKISKATQLIAWLREGIKEKQAASALPTFEQYLENKGIECICPIRDKYITREDVIKSWNEDKYNAYLTAQSYASVFGKLIHPDDGEYSVARKQLSKAISKPSTTTGEGRDLTVTTKVPAFTIKEVDDKFFEIQNLQREYQAKFNQYEHEITNAVDLDKATKDSEYKKAYDEWNVEYRKLYNEYIAWCNSETKRVSDLKISIPDALVDIYNEIQGLGK